VVPGRTPAEPTYYFNATTGESTYEKPKALMREEELVEHEKFLKARAAAERYVKRIEDLQTEVGRCGSKGHHPPPLGRIRHCAPCVLSLQAGTRGVNPTVVPPQPWLQVEMLNYRADLKWAEEMEKARKMEEMQKELEDLRRQQKNFWDALADHVLPWRVRTESIAAQRTHWMTWLRIQQLQTESGKYWLGACPVRK
jgi:hypothetical protein